MRNPDPKKATNHWKIRKSLNNAFFRITTLSSNALNIARVVADTNLRLANEIAAHYSNVSKITNQKKAKQVKFSAGKLLQGARRHKEDLFHSGRTELCN